MRIQKSLKLVRKAKSNIEWMLLDKEGNVYWIEFVPTDYIPNAHVKQFLHVDAEVFEQKGRHYYLTDIRINEKEKFDEDVLVVTDPDCFGDRTVEQQFYDDWF